MEWWSTCLLRLENRTGRQKIFSVIPGLFNNAFHSQEFHKNLVPPHKQIQHCTDDNALTFWLTKCFMGFLTSKFSITSVETFTATQFCSLPLIPLSLFTHIPLCLSHTHGICSTQPSCLLHDQTILAHFSFQVTPVFHSTSFITEDSSNISTYFTSVRCVRIALYSHRSFVVHFHQSIHDKTVICIHQV